MELKEEELENILGGANPEVVKENLAKGNEAYRPRKLEEIQKELEELRAKREEIIGRKHSK